MERFCLEDVGFKPPKSPTWALEGVTLGLAAGEVVALVGANGSGKTSLLRLLNRLADPTRGTIYLEGQLLQSLPVIQVRQQVTLVLQETSLLGMSVGETLTYPLRLRGLDSRVIQERLTSWCEQLEIPPAWLGRGQAELSGGQRQLVAVGRALITEPLVLLLDEPTSALDHSRGTLMIKVLQELASTRGTTILMANHQLNLLAHGCTRLIQLDQGKVIRDQPQDQVNWSDLQAVLPPSSPQP